MRSQPRYQPGDKIGGRYQVHQALMGGMGEVYLCLDLETIHPYALKTFQQRYLTNPKLRTAFENEVATWVALEKHPNIVRCFHMDILDNQPFMILEWIAGEEGKGADLRSWLRRGPLDLRTALDFTIDICRGLIHAQEKQPGLVHRDLKQENILIAQGGLAKITDFGLAQIVQAAELEVTGATDETDERQSLLGQVAIVGTPAYMAPEQWLGDELDPRTDLYAVGCILYEMLTRSRPFEAKTVDGLRRQHMDASIPRLADNQRLPGSLDTLLVRCLSKQCRERFDSADALLQQLEIIYQQQFAVSPKAVPPAGEFTVVDYGNRGNTYYRLGLYDQALDDYAQAIQLAPTVALTYTNRGVVYEKLQRYDEAIADHGHAIQLDPTLSQAYYNRGNTYNKLQRYGEALLDFTRAIELDPTSSRAYYNRGLTYHRLKRAQEALADYSSAIELDPSLAQAYVNRGLILDRLRRYSEALVDYGQAIHLDPNLVQAHSNRGNTYSALGRYDEALADYNRAIELDSTFASAYSGRGTVYCRLRRYEESLADQSYAIQLDPTDAKAYTNQANTYAALQRYDRALEGYGRAIELDPDDARNYYNRALAYDELQRYDEALRDYSRCIQFDSTFAPALHNRGNVYASLQCYDKALADYTQAIKVNPTYASAYYNRGNIYRNLQRDEEALADYICAIRHDPGLAPAHLNLGALLSNRGALRDALPHFKKAAELGLPLGAEYAAKVRQMLGKQQRNE
jgi:tetratricopeptide (TPR) repeat protein